MTSMFYAALTAGAFLTLWGAVVTNNGGFSSFLLIKALPAMIGIWCLFECARVLA